MRPILILIAGVLAVLSTVALVVEVVPITGKGGLESLCRFVPCPTVQQLTTESTEAKIARLKSAVKREPASPYAWCTLGEALAEIGDHKEATYCMNRAVDLGRSIPSILMRSANYFFATGQIETALPFTARILGLVSSYDDVVFGSYRRFEVPISRVLTDGLPAASRPRQAFFEALLNWGDPSRIRLAWEMLTKESLTSDELAASYIDYLILRGMCDQAVSTWVTHLSQRRGDYPETNLLFNGGFEQKPTGTKLDWQFNNIDGVQVERAREAHSGEYALKVAFGGTQNVAFAHVSQIACLPGGEYLFRAEVRTESITTDQGPYFQISTYQSPSQVDIHTLRWNGTHDWTDLKAEFTIPSSTVPVLVQLRRDSSLKFDSRIKGTIWIDDVRIEKVP